MDSVVQDGGYRDVLDKTTEFLKKHCRGTHYDTHRIFINNNEEVVGISFNYPLLENKDEEIGVDLFLSPMFSDHNHLLKELQGITDVKKRRL